MKSSPKISVKTRGKTQFVEITQDVREHIPKDFNGIVTIFVPHTTAGITINENADPDVVTDMITTLNTLVPNDPNCKHLEGNSDSHVKASLMGSSVQVIVENGNLVLGTWQGIYFCEFDGPRDRSVLVYFLPK
jgi:secondary thiamine-phosphate synthase enzyme